MNQTSRNGSARWKSWEQRGSQICWHPPLQNTCSLESIMRVIGIHTTGAVSLGVWSIAYKSYTQALILYFTSIIHRDTLAHKCDGALSAINTQKNFGGSKQQMSDTHNATRGFSGHTLTNPAGYRRHTVKQWFLDTDDCGPAWYLTPEQRD